MFTSNGQLFAMRFSRGRCGVELLGLCLLGFTSIWAVTEPIHAQQAATITKGYEEIAKPFIKQHCLGCHGASAAKAGYRIDLIGTDFSAATVADHWKEVIDRINAGEMPPKDSPRPDPAQVAAFVTWVNVQLRQVDLAAKKAGEQALVPRIAANRLAARALRAGLLVSRRTRSPARQSGGGFGEHPRSGERGYTFPAVD